jgi:translation initiation factor 1
VSPSDRDRAPLVYSSEHGRICAACGQPVARCSCRNQPSLPKPSAAVRVGRETKGRKGKGVTVISGLPLEADALQQLASELKKRCGSGGTVRNGIIEVQGDHRELLLGELQRRGWPAKKSGG